MINVFTDAEVTLLNNTTNEYYVVPHCEGTFNMSSQYRERKIWKSLPQNKLVRIDGKLDISTIDVNSDIRMWIKNKDNITAQVVFDPDDENDSETIYNCKITLSNEWKDEDVIRCKLTIEGYISLS